MTESERCHEQAIERALLTLEPEGAPVPNVPPGDEAVVAALAREYTEVAAMITYGLAPEHPAPEIRDRLMATIAGDAPATRDRARRVVRDDSHRFPPASTLASPSEPRRASPWTLALAAMLGLCLVGLAFIAGQQSGPRSAGSRSAGPRSAPVVATDTASSDIETIMQAQAAMTERLNQVERNLFMVTNIARAMYPIRQADNARLAANRAGVRTSDHQGAVDGKIFVCGQHQQWYLNVRGLTPPPADRAYQLWFVTEDGPVPAGILNVDTRQPTELAAAAMPPNTTGFAISMEPVTGPRDGQIALAEAILVADQPIQL